MNEITTQQPGAADPAAAPDAAVPGTAADAAPQSAPWWEDTRFDDSTQTQLKALGLTVDDPLDAVQKLTQMERAAKQKLGKSPDALMERPAKDGNITEWLRQNGDMFGIPDAPDSYAIEKPKDWPDGAPWDEALETAARTAAHDLGLSQAQMSGMTAVYAQHMASMLGDVEAGAQAAQADLMGALQKDWGDQTDAKIAAAQQAASAIAEAAGLDADAMAAMHGLLSSKAGDAHTIRMFATIGEMMGEDSIIGARTGSASLSTTPAEARAKLAAMQAPDSDYSKAVAAKRQGRPSNFDRLDAERQRLINLAAQ